MEQQHFEVNVSEHIKRKMKGQRRYKNENRVELKTKPRVFEYSPIKKPNWWTRMKKFIKCVVGRKND